MDRLVRRHLKNQLRKGVKREYYEREYVIYTEAEARDAGVEFVYWKEADAGDWGLSDDGYVSECLKRKDYNGRINMVFPFGQTFYGKNFGKLEYEPRKETGSFSAVSAKPWWEQSKGKAKYKAFTRSYVQMFLAGKVDLSRLGRIFSADEEKPVARSKSLLKKPYIQEMIDEELRKQFSDKDIDEGTVIDMIKDAFDIARGKSDPANMLRASESFVKMLGMDNKNKQNSLIQADIMTIGEIEDVIELDEKKAPLLDS